MVTYTHCTTQRFLTYSSEMLKTALISIHTPHTITHTNTHDKHNHIEPEYTVVKLGLMLIIVWATSQGSFLPSDKKENQLVEKCAGFFIVIDQTRSGTARGKASLSKGRDRERGRRKPSLSKRDT